MKRVPMHPALFFLLILCAPSFAQTDTGMPSYEVMYPVNAYESVNLGNLSILLQAPVRSKSGPIPLNFMLTDNVQISTPGTNYATTATGAGLARGYWAGQIVYSTSLATCTDGTGRTTTQWTITGIYDQNATFHPLGNLNLGVKWDRLGCIYLSLDTFTKDGTGYEVVIPAGGGSQPSITVYDKMGVQFHPSTFGSYLGQIIDAHGNTVTVAQGGSPRRTQHVRGAGEASGPVDGLAPAGCRHERLLRRHAATGHL